MQTPGNSADPNLCAGCATGSTTANVSGGNGLVVLVFSTLSSTTTLGNNGPLCPGSTLNLSSTSASAISFTWSGPAAFTSSIAAPSIPAATNADSGLYTLIVSDVIGCADTFTTNATVNSNPVAGINPPDTLTCAVLSDNLTATSNLGGANTYNWGNAVTSNPYVVSQPGSYSVTITDAANCTASATVSVAQDIAVPTASINAPATLTCALTTVTLTSVTNTTGALYAWSNSISTDTSNVTNPGIYSVTITDPSSFCSASATVSVSQNIVPPPVAINLPDTLTCSDTLITLTAVSPVNGAIYSWSNSAFTVNTDTTSLPGVYTVTATDPVNDCTASASVTVIQNIVPPGLSINPPALLPAQ